MLGVFDDELLKDVMATDGPRPIKTSSVLQSFDLDNATLRPLIQHPNRLNWRVHSARDMYYVGVFMGSARANFRAGQVGRKHFRR